MADSLVRSRLVEVGDVRCQDAPEVPLAEDQQVVDALAPDAAEEAFADRVGVSRQLHLVVPVRSDFGSSIRSIR